MPKRLSRQRGLSETRQAGARNFVCRKNRRTTGWFPSWKAGQLVPWESRNEHDYVVCAEVTRSISAIQAQPLQLSFELDGKRVRYTPDYAVTRASRSALIEVKPDKVARTEDAQVFFAAAREAARLRGYSFEVVTDKELRAGHRLANAIDIVHLSLPHDRPELRQSILLALDDGITALGAIAPEPDEKRWFVYRMLRLGELEVAPDQRLDLKSTLSVVS